jgi:hypothetical protein
MTTSPRERAVTTSIEPEVGDGWPAHGLGPVSEILALLPDPAELQPGAWIAVGSGSHDQRGLLSRLFGSQAPRARVHLAVRCTALLIRGYTAIAADDAGIAYGRVPL